MFLTLGILATMAAGGEPSIAAKGYGAKADAPLLVGDWRTFTVDGAPAGKVLWEIDPIPELAFDAKGKPYLLSGDAGLLEVTKPLTPFRVTGDGIKIDEVAPGGVIVWGITPGKVRLTARGVVDGLPKRLAVLVIEVQGPRPPPVGDKPPVQSGKLYYAIIKPDGPTSPAVFEGLKLGAWNELKAAGHSVGVLTASRARELGLTVPDTLPVVQPLVNDPEKKQSREIPPPLAFPKTDADVRKLMEVKP